MTSQTLRDEQIEQTCSAKGIPFSFGCSALLIPLHHCPRDRFGKAVRDCLEQFRLGFNLQCHGKS